MSLNLDRLKPRRQPLTKFEAELALEDLIRRGVVKRTEQTDGAEHYEDAEKIGGKTK
jgi:hypothetical protein